MKFKRKIYDKMLSWKNESKGRTALLIEGPRRVGKSTTVKEFASKEYESFILIDFFKASNKIPQVNDVVQLVTDDKLYIVIDVNNN